jgi:hypothetical protein
MIDNANKCEFLMNVYFEKELETNIVIYLLTFRMNYGQN